MVAMTSLSESSTISNESQPNLEKITEFAEIAGQRAMDLIWLLNTDKDFASWDNRDLSHQARQQPHVHHKSVVQMSSSLSRHLDAFNDCVCYAQVLLTDIFDSFFTPRSRDARIEYNELKGKVFEELERLQSSIEKAQENRIKYLQKRCNWEIAQASRQALPPWIPVPRRANLYNSMAIILMDWTAKLRIRLTAMKIVQGYWNLVDNIKETSSLLAVPGTVGMRLSSFNPMDNIFA